MKHAVYALLLILIILLVSCQTAPTAGADNFDTATPELSHSDPTVTPKQDPDSSFEPGEALPITHVEFETVDQLIAFNQNPTAYGANPYALQALKEGHTLHRDYNYIPVMPDVSDYYTDGRSYELYGIAQWPSSIEFVYRSTSAKTEEDALLSEVRISINWYADNQKEDLEKQFGVEQDQDGYIFVSEQHRMLRRLEDTCYLEVYMPNYPALYEFMQKFCTAEKIAIDSANIPQ